MKLIVKGALSNTFKFRAVVSSLEDLETKYARALEEKILLEHELQDKASVEEDMQRLRDELRGDTLKFLLHSTNSTDFDPRRCRDRGLSPAHPTIAPTEPNS